MRFQSYINTAVKIIEAYNGELPLHHFLKQYFAQHKKHGSKDRKLIANLCYNFYRTGKAFTNLSIEEKLKAAIFLCNNISGEWNFLYDDGWLNNWSEFLQQRIAFLKTKYTSFSLKDVFPFTTEVSKDLNIDEFAQSFFVQPDVFVRIRPGYKHSVTHKLRVNKIAFDLISEDCIALPALTKIDAIFNIDEEAVIQDYSSQRINEFLKLIKPEIINSSAINVWDCCAGSGGKSILAYDVFENINLTVSDIRTSIIQNLKQRFAKANIKNHSFFIADLSKPLTQLPLIKQKKFDLIICDTPCTGSGTWSRTPEQLYFFQHKKIDSYALLQQKIIRNTITFLNNNGFFLYVTCSVFEKENEAAVEFIKRQFQLELLNSKLLKGYNRKADTLFAVLFKKKN